MNQLEIFSLILDMKILNSVCNRFLFEYLRIILCHPFIIIFLSISLMLSHGFHSEKIIKSGM